MSILIQLLHTPVLFVIALVIFNYFLLFGGSTILVVKAGDLGIGTPAQSISTHLDKLFDRSLPICKLG